MHSPEHYWDTEHFFLGDFELSMDTNSPGFQDEIFSNAIPPWEYCSPERLHGKKPRTACDMWSYMILFTRLWCGIAPFTPYLEGGVMTGITIYLGRLPYSWKSDYCWPKTRCDKWYSDADKPMQENDFVPAPASIMKQACPSNDPVMADEAAVNTAKVFIYESEKRPSANDLLWDPRLHHIPKK
ncbi:hypothetical protein N7462_005456 [Penicillium macrosclerotiorum]|uniref:uncharacterized protein n=1 Tax=Penicillium macrosclerotiorum TaxID=303699 RepID=UPI002548A768|nr:uncharacterized protein N7462_005456 [Penicillium macrosclerotiorum]KAJ5682291.1 hypothetical protein N7462_005456 [Penicillium macrosclerotiorum]